MRHAGLAQAEAALDTDEEPPSCADARASRTIRILGDEYLRDSRTRGKQPRTMEWRESRLNVRIVSTIGEAPVAKWRVEYSRNVMEERSETLFPSAAARTCAPAVDDAEASVAAGLDRSIRPLDGLEIGWANLLHRGDGRRPRSLVWLGGHRPADVPTAAVRDEDRSRRLRWPAPGRAERTARPR